MFEGELDIKKFLVLNLGLWVLQIFLASFCFLFACLFNEIRYSIGIGAGLGLLFVLIQMLSQVNEDIEFLKYATPLTLFQPESIIQYETMAFICIGILAVLSIVCFLLAHLGFVKRDLPL